MSGNNYVIDTNIISFFLKGDSNLLPYFNFTVIHISFITELELRAIPVNEFLRTCIITDINPPIKEAAITFKKEYRLKLPDAIIAATASYLGHELITADKSFKRLPLPLIFYIK